MITINKFKVNSLIPNAVEIIKTDFPTGELSNTYSGYISSLSADFIQLTPLATAIMYESSKNSEEDKSKVTEWVMKLIGKTGNLSNFIADNTTNGKIKTSVLIELLTAINALKIAIRKFKLT